LVDNLKIANLLEYYTSSSENILLLAEFKISLNAYLSELVASPIRSLADAIAFNKNPGSDQPIVITKLMHLTPIPLD
jgi:amidase